MSRSRKPKPVMIECEDCCGSGVVQAECHQCMKALYTDTVSPVDPDLCKDCAEEDAQENLVREMERVSTPPAKRAKAAAKSLGRS